MINLMILILIPLLITMMMMLINFLTQKKIMSNREKNSPFECGFDPLTNARLPFSINFFMISLIFLIFDIEITLILPIIISIYMPYMNMMTTFYIFLMILLIGLYIEWLEKNLEWMF